MVYLNARNSSGGWSLTERERERVKERESCTVRLRVSVACFRYLL